MTEMKREEGEGGDEMETEMRVEEPRERRREMGD